MKRGFRIALKEYIDMKANLFINSKYAHVYEATVQEDCGTFKIGETVKFAIAITEFELDEIVEDRIKETRRMAGGDYVLLDEVPEDFFDGYFDAVLTDMNNYKVYAASEKEFYITSFANAKKVFKCKYAVKGNPVQLVSDVCCYRHNSKLMYHEMVHDVDINPAGTHNMEE